MWISWWGMFFMVIWTSVNSYYLRGSMAQYKPQKILMLHDHSACLSDIHHMSLRQTLTYSFLCFKFKVVHCLVEKQMVHSSLDEYNFLRLQNSSYCGLIWLLGKSQTSHKVNIFIGVTGSHNIHLNVLRFHFFLANHIPCHQHGMFLSYKNVKTETYCGIRMPWDIIVKGNMMVMHLSIAEFLDYLLQLFYSSFFTGWITNISQIVTAYVDYSLSFHFITPFTFLNINVRSYTYYVISHQQNYLMLHLSLSEMSFKTHVIIYDGPGDLSRNIFEINHAKLKIYRYIRTTAFVAYINIKLVDYNLSLFKGINITLTHKKHKASPCVDYRRGLIKTQSNKWINVACMRTFKVPLYEIKIVFEYFRFIGANELTDLSDSVCQYGGLVVQLDNTKQQHEFCESLYHYTLYSSNKSLTFIVVWFSRYSQGGLKASLSLSHCKTSYPEFYLSNTALISPDILYKPTLSQQCEMFVCPALQNHHQRRFTVQLGPHSLGTTRISIRYLYTLRACDPEIKYDHESEINIKSVDIENWPLQLTPNIYQSNHNNSDNVLFFYLHTANVSVGYICRQESTRLQMAVVVARSSCQKGKIDKPYVVNNMPSLSGACSGSIYYFTPSAKGSKGYINFIYTDSGYINDGIDLQIDYWKCPMKCRNYKYSTFVKMADNKTIYEYTTSVGQLTYTGKNHRGFRLTILLPNKLCDRHLQCELELQISKGRFRIVEPSIRHKQSPLHLYKKR